MKKLFFLSAVVGLAAFAANAGTAELYSCNTVGVHKVTGAYSEVEVPVPFEAIGGGAADLGSLLYIDNLTMGDTVQTSINSQYGFYDLWSTVIFPDFGISMLYPSARTMRMSSGAVEVDTPQAADCTLARGAGVKVIHANASGGVYVMGQYTTERPSTLIKGNTKSFLVNPLNVDLDIETAFSNDNGVNRNDRILIQDGDAQKVYQWNKNGSDGKHWRISTRQIKNGEEVVAYVYDSPKIGPGKSFTYERNASADLTFTW